MFVYILSFPHPHGEYTFLYATFLQKNILSIKSQGVVKNLSNPVDVLPLAYRYKYQQLHLFIYLYLYIDLYIFLKQVFDCRGSGALKGWLGTSRLSGPAVTNKMILADVL